MFGVSLCFPTGYAGRRAYVSATEVDPLVTPLNLLTDSQSYFSSATGINLRNNFEIVDGRLTTLGNSSKAAALSLTESSPVADPYFALAEDFGITESLGTTFRFNLNGDFLTNTRQLSEDWQGYYYLRGDGVSSGNFNALEVKPKNNTSLGSFDGVKVYNLSGTDPTKVACDVLIIGGDSNSANATSDLVTKDNREIAYDPRIWYMPCLRDNPRYDAADVDRHVPTPMIEPVICSEAAKRMTPQHAAASRIADWSASRGRPLLVMSLGDAGSGLMNTEDWRSPSRRSEPTTNQQESTIGRMWEEMLAMKAALEALGPQHRYIGACWSLGENDKFNTPDPNGYDMTHTGVYQDFFNDVRSLFGDIPLTLNTVAPHTVGYYDGLGELGRGSYQDAWVRTLDKDSGSPNAVANLKVVQTVDNQPALPLDLSDPHYNAVGIQENGRRMGDALLSML